MGNYMCCFCGQSYDDADAYAKCVSACVAQKRVAEEKQRREELEANRSTRIAEIRAVEKQLVELKHNFKKDYGYYIDLNVAHPFDIFFG